MASPYTLPFYISLGPSIILLALNFPRIFYQNLHTRYATFVAILAANASVIIVFHKQVDNAFLAYVIGLYESWFILWAMVLIVIHKPHEEFCRLHPQYIQLETDIGIISADYYLTWQKFPERLSFKRLFWTLDLFINFRGVCWDYKSDSKRTPKSVEANVRGNLRDLPSTKKVRDIEPKSSRMILLHAGTRLAFDIAWLDMCQAMIFPWIRHRLQAAEFLAIDQSIFDSFALRSLELVISTTAIMSLVDLLNTTGLLSTALFNKTPFFGTYSYHWAYPEPWGTLKAVSEDGIIGFYAHFWHTYFQYGYREIAKYLIPHSLKGIGKFQVRISRVFIGFLLSGFMHFCASSMFPYPSKPTREFSYFILQALGVSIQLLGKTLFPTKSIWRKRVFNIIFCYTWLYLTQHFLADDLLFGGFWDTRLLQIWPETAY